jgi:hypothetical protein
MRYAARAVQATRASQVTVVHAAEIASPDMPHRRSTVHGRRIDSTATVEPAVSAAETAVSAIAAAKSTVPATKAAVAAPEATAMPAAESTTTVSAAAPAMSTTAATTMCVDDLSHAQ